MEKATHRFAFLVLQLSSAVPLLWVATVILDWKIAAWLTNGFEYHPRPCQALVAIAGLTCAVRFYLRQVPHGWLVAAMIVPGSAAIALHIISQLHG